MDPLFNNNMPNEHCKLDFTMQMMMAPFEVFSDGFVVFTQA